MNNSIYRLIRCIRRFDFMHIIISKLDFIIKGSDFNKIAVSKEYLYRISKGIKMLLILNVEESMNGEVK